MNVITIKSVAKMAEAAVHLEQAGDRCHPVFLRPVPHPMAAPSRPLMPRLVLLPEAVDAEGEPRIALLQHGHRAVPHVFPTVAAALAELRRRFPGHQAS